MQDAGIIRRADEGQGPSRYRLLAPLSGKLQQQWRAPDVKTDSDCASRSEIQANA